MNSVATSPEWADVFTTFHGRIYNYIYRRTSDPALADDLAADVFARAIDADRRRMGPKESLGGWLFRIAHNLIIDQYRKREKEKLAFGNAIELDIRTWYGVKTDDGQDGGTAQARNSEICGLLGPGPHEEMEQRLLREQIDRALRSLTSEQATVIRRRADGYSFEDIAKELDKTVGAVKALQHRAYTRLREQLKRG